EKQRGLLKIERRRKVNENLYKYLLEKRANTIIARAGIVPETKVIESARNVGVVRPNESRYMILGGGVGAILALLFTFFRTFFYYRISSLKELRELAELPVLGQLFRHKTAMRQDQLVFLEGGRGVHLEALRTVRANLQYFFHKERGNMIQINSVGPGEGKSFVSANLAHILAKAEKNVLLLELDLHKPRLHRVFEKDGGQEGLSAFLAGNVPKERAIMDSGIDGLDVALCGEVPPNASELLLKKELEDMLSYGKAHYDYMVIDTPPAGVISDAFVLMPKVDLNLFIINAQFSRRQELRFIERTVEERELDSVGLLLNGVRRQRLRYYYDRYGYMYGYGYGKGYYGYGRS
ncbi:MAG: CpsD/CapB family tyrosine-protein kinase, partial [Flavobacteriales bacterium]